MRTPDKMRELFIDGKGMIPLPWQIGDWELSNLEDKRDAGGYVVDFSYEMYRGEKLYSAVFFSSTGTYELTIDTWDYSGDEPTEPASTAEYKGTWETFDDVETILEELER